MRPGDRKAQRKEDVESEVLLARVLKLPESEQLQLHHALSGALGAQLGRETKRAKQARLRYEALKTLREAAAYLGLSAEQMPSITDFKRAARETQLPMTFSGVYEAFESNWETASRFYRGEEVPATAAQRAARRAIAGRNRTDREAPITGLRLFLTQDPPPLSTSLADYQEWAREMNEHLPRGWQRLVENPDHIRGVSRTSWANCLAVARNEKTLEQAQQQTLDVLLAECGPLIGHHLASWVLGISVHSNTVSRPGYPQPVARLGKTNWLWLLSDIRAYGAGKRDFTQARGALQHSYMDSDELAARLEIWKESVRQRIAKARVRENWTEVPPPTGRAGKQLYWERAQVERWLQEHPGATGPKRGRKQGHRRSRSVVSEISGQPARAE